ncbi:hypothetical protein M758_10G082000 [Ceratodon purpureus]|uniref:Cystathionine beta-lyase, chloroplastic n=1 Tax=Ceratodon purpureus TaxID=3225 RepID=A0A8T0GQ85_CERPU|nr:hypothetical protein KC19_10G083400 [Ceratodon purpureus]KAG0603293.1 hypothetical protein M758_10G082000 [Ceratodon purpureus]
MAMEIMDYCRAAPALAPRVVPHLKLTTSSAHFPSSQPSAGWVTVPFPLKSSLDTGSFRFSAFVVKTPASTLTLATRAVTTYTDEIAEEEVELDLKAEGEVEFDLTAESDGELHISTQLQQLDNPFDPYGALSTPLYQTATFKQPSATEGGPYDYTRSGNPTRDALERTLAKLENADRAFCFSTGTTALATITRLAEAGQEIVAGDNIYGGAERLLTCITPKSGVIVRRIDTGDLDAVRKAIGPKTKIVWLESPTNPRQLISDIREIAKIAHEHGSLVVVDNSIMSPILSKPLNLGADIVINSATKFISGHSDVMGGVLAVRGESLAKEIYFLQNAEGTGLSPFDSWLCLRGIKTLALRVEKQQANAQKIAEFLVAHPLITHVNYAGLSKHPRRDLHYSQCKGAGSVLSFNTDSLAVSKHVVEQTKLFSITVSFGSVKSLISLPCFMSHASIPADVRVARGLTDDLIRISVGIEDVDDLIADLEQALKTAPQSSES